MWLNGSSSINQLYGLTNGYVISQNPDVRTLSVMLRDGQILSNVPVLHLGACDALRVDQKPLPGKGTTGVLAMVNGDVNSAVWLGGYTSTLADAFASSGDTFLDYQSHWSGFWQSQDSSGSTTMVWPDGSQLVVGVEFQPTRHVTDSTGKRVSIPFTAAARVAATPSPFPVVFTHATGTKVEVDAAGNVSVSGVAKVSALDGAGSYWQLDDAGNLNVLANLNVTGNIHSTAAVIAGYGGADQVGLQTHDHPQGPDSHGDTEQNTGPPVAGT